MVKLAENSLSMEKVTDGISLVRNLRFIDARHTFGPRLLDIKETHELLSENPNARSKLRDLPFVHSKSISIASYEPLISFRQKDDIVFPATYCIEQSKIVLPIRDLERAGINLEQKMPLLVINECYDVSQQGSNFLISLNLESASVQNDIINLYERPCFSKIPLRLYSDRGNFPVSGHPFKQINGVPAGDYAPLKGDPDALRIYVLSPMGPTRRGHVETDPDYKRDFVIGGGFGRNVNVLVHNDPKRVA
jgi:hypothetical protein